MYICEIIKPGTKIVNDDRKWAWEIEGILRHLENDFYEANLLLNMFVDSLENDTKEHSLELWKKDTCRRAEIEREVRKKYENPYDHSVRDGIRLETEVTFNREQWAAGRLPEVFKRSPSFIYARSFLYALDSFDKFLGVLKQQESIPKEILELHDEMAKVFPDLRGVRNSAQHMEDRSRGLGAGRRPKPLDIKPTDNGFVKSDGGVLMLNCLNGTKYGNTMADGHYGEVDVSQKSMVALGSIFQGVLDAFSWTGSKSHLPRT